MANRSVIVIFQQMETRATKGMYRSQQLQWQPIDSFAKTKKTPKTNAAQKKNMEASSKQYHITKSSYKPQENMRMEGQDGHMQY
jgi:hypothetical protein